MKVSLTLEEALQYTKNPEYRVLPLSTELLCDDVTPMEVLRRLRKISAHCYLLESVSGPEAHGRYTFLGYDPKTGISCRNGKIKIGDVTFTTENPARELRRLMKEYRSPKLENLPPFTGGLVGYFSYDYFGYQEPRIRTAKDDDAHFQDLDLMLFDRVIAFDHFRQKLILIANMRLDEPETEYHKALQTLAQMKELVLHGEKAAEPESRMTGELTPLFDREAYCEMVEKAKHYIHEGDIFQIVLSNRFSAPFTGSLLNTYRVLRTVNPSPYMFYFSGTDVEVAGASPETLVKLEDGVLHTFPLAGTRPRGKTAAEDKALEADLLQDEKELAEHNMLVDLGRNDLGRISRFGSVEVEKLHEIERYSHVMHIGSTVRGEIRPECDALDAVGAVLPAGTLSGAPKIRACQLIGELEGSKRGIYGGAVGYLSFQGDLDMCIAIRLAYRKGGTVYIRSGAGIVADSVPEKEYQECINKAAAVVHALKEQEALSHDSAD